MLSAPTHNRGAAGLPLIRPLVIQTRPEDDESLPGLLATATQRNVLAVTRIILEEVGLKLPRPGLVGQELGALADRLALKIGCSPDEILPRVHPYINQQDNCSLVSWCDDQLRREDLILVKRRISPATLRTQEHHSAAWLLDLLPYCPRSFERLIDCCNSCGEALGWVAARGIGTCEHCRCKLEHPDGETLPEELRSGYGILDNLLSIVPGIRAAQLAAFPPKMRTLPLPDLLDLIFGLGRATVLEANDENYSRILPGKELLTATVLATGAELLVEWPHKIRAWLAAIADDPAFNHHRTLRLIKRLGSKAVSAEVAEIVREHLPELFTGGRSTLGSLAAPVMHPLAFMTAGGFTSLQYRHLRDGGHLGSTIKTGTVRPSVQFSKHIADDLIEAKRLSEPLTALAQALGLPRYAAEQLTCLGEVTHVDRPAFRTLEMPTRVATSSKLSFLENLLNVDGPAPAGAQSLVYLMRRFSGGEKPWGPVLQSLGRRQFHYWLSPDAEHTNGKQRPIIRRLLVYPQEFQDQEFQPFQEPEFSDFPFEEHIPQQDALEVLGVKHAMLLAAAAAGEIEFTSGPGSSQVADRRTIRNLAIRYVSPLEISHRLGLVGNNLALRAMRKYPAVRRSQLGWLRKECDLLLPQFWGSEQTLASVTARSSASLEELT